MSMGDRKLTMSFRYADTACTPAQVKTLMQNIISNGDIFSEVPTSIVGAEFYSTGVTPIVLPA